MGLANRSFRFTYFFKFNLWSLSNSFVYFRKWNGSNWPIENNTVEDDYRIDYLKQHVKAIKQAIEEDYVDCFGYAWWGPIDIISAGTEKWKRYGFVYVDLDDQGHGTGKRYKKKSFEVYKKLLKLMEKYKMLHYLPGCDVRKSWTSYSKITKYMQEQGAIIDKCCRSKDDFLKEGDILVQNCTLCQLLIKENIQT